MKRRVRVLPPGYLVGTKGHSVLKKKTYVRRPLIEVEEYSKMPTSRRHEYDSNYQLGSFHDARAFSNAVMDDSYDLQSQSRGRDHRLLSHMNDALHTDSPPTSPLLSSRSSKPRNISQLQTKTRRSIRFDTSGTEPSKSYKLSDSLKTPMTSDSYKSSKPPSSLKSSKPLSSLKLSKLSDSFKLSKPYESGKLSKKTEPLTLPKQHMPSKIYKPVEPLIRVGSSDSLQVPKPPEPLKKTHPSESLQLVKVPEPLRFSGLERMSPVVEHARSLLNRQRTFGIDSKLDTIATSAVTAPRDLKSDFYSISPLSNYIKTRWPEKELDEPLAIEAPPKKGIYKNPYLDSDDEDYEVVLKSSKPRKTGDLLKELRKQKRTSGYTVDDESDVEDDVTSKGAYAMAKYTDDDDDEDMSAKPRISKRYEIEDSPGELAISHLVSSAAIRAKAVLENLTGLLGKGGMINVEGDVKPYGGDVTSFRLHTPFHFQGPLMIGEKPAVSVGDDSFERYIFGLQEKRKDERNKVEKDSRRITKISRTLSHEAPKQYSLKPIGYISERSYDSFAKSMVPFQNKFDRTAISSSSKKVHFDEEDDDMKRRPAIGFSRELVPFVPKGVDADEMAVVPKRKRFPVYEYTEDIPVKFSIDFPRLDEDGNETKEKLSVLEKIRIKALLVGEDKLDDPDRPRPRKPRTRYYAEKLNKMDDNKEQLSSIMATTPKTRPLKASKPPNYRLDSHLEPDDLIHKPSTYVSMRDQVRGVQDKLDRHRQLLDRYRETDVPATYDPIVHRRTPVLGERIISHADRVAPDVGFVDSHAAGGNLSAGRTSEDLEAADGFGKVSPLRKKLRKVICKSRHNPSYYDE